MESSSREDSGAPSGGTMHSTPQHQVVPPTAETSIPPTTGPNTNRLLALFTECVESGVRATLETYKKRGAVHIDFFCSIVASPDANTRDNSNRRRKKRARNAARTREWKGAQQQQPRHLPPSAIPTTATAALPAASTAAVEGQAPGTATPARSFATVAAQAVQKELTATSAVKAVGSTAAGLKESKTMAANPSIRVKKTLAASRASQRATILKKRREVAAAGPTATTPSDAEETAPEVLRGTEGTRALNISLESSTPLSPPPLDLTRVCGCESDCEDDFHEELIEKGVRLNTSDPHWETVFTRVRGMCRFCHVECTPTGVGECQNCAGLSIFQCVKKFAPRWYYPKC